MKPIDAWLNTATGTIIPSIPANASFGRKPTVIKIKAIVNEAGTDYINANGEANVASVLNSKSIERIVNTLQAVNEQRRQLIASALMLPGGEQALKLLELYDPDVDGQVAALPIEPKDPELEAMKKQSKRNVPAKKDASIDL